MRVIAVTKLAVFIIATIWSTHLALTEEKTKVCFKIGDTVTIRGRANGMINAGTYFVLLEPRCGVLNLTTVGPKLPPNIYVEVTGELLDLFPYGLVGIWY